MFRDNFEHFAADTPEPIRNAGPLKLRHLLPAFTLVP